jgi:glycosyltransferase involved in cell wall biosynthesis
VADLFAASDLFVSTSRTEGFGISMAEAMLAGVPVIGTPVGILEDSPELARIVPVEADAREWAKAITLDWSDTEGRTRRAETAQCAIRERYGVETHVDRWAAYLHGLGASRRRQSKPRLALGTPHCVPCMKAQEKAQESGSPLPASTL